jgi:16S rRNA (cytosine967-C5)-methyltransferase
LSETDIGRLAVLQTELLEAAARIVRPNGTLVYATCSLEAEENEDQVDAFLARHPEFRTEPPESIDTRYLDGKGWLRIQPHEHGFDGAFAARLRRV